MGGFGEIYRPYYQRLFGQENSDQIYSESLFENTLSGLKNTPLSDYVYKESLGLYLECFSNLPGDTLSKKLDSHYFNFRNRFHFGVKRTRKGQPLAISTSFSIYLLKAAQGLPQSDKVTGRVLFDVTKAICPQVAYHEYDKKIDWQAIMNSKYHKKSLFDHAPPKQLNPDFGLASVNNQDVKSIRRPKFSFVDKLSEEMLASKGVVERSSLREIFTNDVFEQLDAYREKNINRYAAWCSRVSSLADMLYIEGK